MEAKQAVENVLHAQLTEIEKIIDQMEDVRRENNKNWMDILRLAFKANPQAAALIFLQVHEKDDEIGELAKKLIKVASQ